jgi:nicotinamide-nucleotide amidase
MRIEIICTGDEILTGKTVNTNFSHLSRKLQEVGLPVLWGTTVGDDPDTLLEAFRMASTRADVVIVNGGLGPTVDDLSQEIAAKAAGVDLVLHEDWLAHIEAMFRRFGMTMRPNNRKQAMLPATAELIDNPIGTACGFALDIGKARFFFTPGVPRELYRMLDEQILPRLLARSGKAAIVRVKRFHVYGVGESNADSKLAGLEEMVPDHSVKLGFQAHYPQLEVKLSAQGTDAGELAARLAPVEAELRARLGNFIVAEDDDTLESVVLKRLRGAGASLAVVETFTCGLLGARLAQPAGAEGVFRRGLTASTAEIETLLGLAPGMLADGALSEDALATAARAAQRHTGASHALVVLAEREETENGTTVTCWFGIAAGADVAVRCAHLRFGGIDWLRAGTVEMALDTLRRYLAGLPIAEKIDFERR